MDLTNKILRADDTVEEGGRDRRARANVMEAE